MVDVLGRTEHDPVERQLEKIAAGLDGALMLVRRAHVAAQFLDGFHGPRLRSLWVRIASELRSARKKWCVAKRLSRRAEHSVEDRVDVLQMIAKVKQLIELVAG